MDTELAIVAVEIVPGYRQAVVRFSGPRCTDDAVKLWRRVRRVRDASLRVVDDTGQTFGHTQYADQHGVGGVFTERCHECDREFVTPRVGERVCPACDLLLEDDSWRQF
jgi:hypothetical protein